MSRVVLQARGLTAREKEKAVMERREVGHPDDESATDPQTPADLVKYPEYLLDVLEDLVGDDDVECLRFERQCVRLQIQVENLDVLGSKQPLVLRKDFDGEESSIRHLVTRNRQIVASAGAEVEDVGIGSGRAP